MLAVRTAKRKTLDIQNRERTRREGTLKPALEFSFAEDSGLFCSIISPWFNPGIT